MLEYIYQVVYAILRLIKYTEDTVINKLDINVLDMIKESESRNRETEGEKVARKKEQQAAFEKRKQEELDYNASLRTHKVKLRVRSLLKGMDREGVSLDDCLFERMGSHGEDLESFIRSLIAVGGVKQNILVALMDKKQFFNLTWDERNEAAGEAHEEWWNGGQAEAECFR